MSLFSKLFGRKSAASAASAASPASPASAAAQTLDLQAFSQRFAGALRDTFPDAPIRIHPGAQNEARIELTLEDGLRADLQVGNAYQRYLNAPADLEAILADQIASVHDMQRRFAAEDAQAGEGVLLPVIKTREWHEVAMRQVQAMTAAQSPFVIEPLAGDLIVSYVLDTPASMSYLSPEQVAQRELDGPALRAHALDNLAQRLPELRIEGGDGRYAARLDRNYDAGMALLFERWRDRAPDLRGEPVFAIAARDELLMCGSEDRENLAELREIAREISRDSAYGLSAGLYVWRDGGLRAFEG